MKEEAAQENSAPQTEAPAKAEPSFEEQLNRDAQQHAMTVYDQTLRAQRNSANDAICQYESMVAELRFKLGKLSEKRQAEQAEVAKTIADLTAKVADLETQLKIATANPPAPDATPTPSPVGTPAATDPAPAMVAPAVVQSIPAVHVIQAIDAPKSDSGTADYGSEPPESVPAASDASVAAAG